MNTLRPCGCKGVRTCLTCEKDFEITKPSLHRQFQELESWSYCVQCKRLYAGWDTQAVQSAHPDHENSVGLPLPGIFVQECFLSPEEGAQLISDLDALPWAISQSGRRKQNFGPKTNFKNVACSWVRLRASPVAPATFRNASSWFRFCVTFKQSNSVRWSTIQAKVRV